MDIHKYGGYAFDWEEVQKIPEIESDTTEKIENIDENTIRKVYDWTNLYGELNSGEYEFLLSGDNSTQIRIYFTINESGEVSDIDVNVNKQR